MFRCIVSSIAVLVLATAAHAQTSADMDGNWLAKFKGPTGYDLQAKLSVDGDAAVWQLQLSLPSNPCLGRPTQASLKRIDERNVELRLFGSRSLTGCPDWTLQLVRVDADTYEADFGEGRMGRFARRRP